MYKYNEIDQKLVDERVQQFRGQVQRFLDGKLTEDEFRPLRLMNGLYQQLHAPMLRVAIPYGLLSSEQLRMLAHIARAYDKGYGHFSTRQNIQYNWPSLESVPDILADLAKVEMHAIQTSGNCIRNITSDQLAGVTADEIEDPRPYCEIIRQWSTLHPEFSYLPRKFKIAVSGAIHDRAATQVHDIGIHIVKNAQGETGFRILVGGGLGRTPIIGQVICEFLDKQYVLSYLEAILRIYNQHGRRDNKYKSRIKILVKALGIAAFKEQVEAEWQHIKNDPKLHLSETSIEHFKAFFNRIAYQANLTESEVTYNKAKSNAEFTAWLEHNTVAHKVPGYRIAYVSLKPIGKPPGDITDTQMDTLAEIADQHSYGYIRSTHDQNLVLTDIKHEDLYQVWEKLKAIELATPNIGTLTDIICCPGLDYCSLANATSIPVSNKIQETFADYDYLYDLGNIKVKISGCMNACGHHHVGHIGILGVDKKGEEYYQILLGGSAENDTSIGKILGPAFSRDEVVPAIQKILDVYLEQREGDESFLETYRRVGFTPFKEKVYAAH